jgi:predicted neutral ceramidase superfamily lipid hydrolase
MFYFIEITLIFFAIVAGGTLTTIGLYSKKAPVLKQPPKGWGVQLNSLYTAIIGGSFIVGEILTILLGNITFQEVFFILGTIVSYIVAFTIYFSFTTVERPGYLLLALIQPIIGITLYSIYTAQISVQFFIRAIIFFCSCAFIYALPYARGLFHVSNIYRDATGLGGYGFIRAFVLSMMTDGNDEKIEELFDRVGIDSEVKIQYLALRTQGTKKLKGLFLLPDIHFGPFKTCGSSDLPEHLYKAFENIPGTTVYHTTNDHSHNLTTQKEVEEVLDRIQQTVTKMKNEKEIKWQKKVSGFKRNMENTAKLIGIKVDDVPIVFLTRHPLPSDDIQAAVGKQIHENVTKKNFHYKDIMIVDSHNSIIGDEILIKKGSLEANDLVEVVNNYLQVNQKSEKEGEEMLYGVAKDHLEDYSEKDGIGYGGMMVHLFQSKKTGQKTALIHLDANNAYVDIRSFILNKLQNRGIDKGEMTTSDSHTVARQFSSRGYSPIGDKIKIDYILEKLDEIIKKAENDLEPIEFHYESSIEKNIRIWGDLKYFDAIMKTLEECISVSERLLTLSLIVPTFFSLILLLFYYNIQIEEILN